jgi:hypothetical protein
MNTPVFTTSHPGFMASTENANREFIEKHRGETSLASKCEGVPVYIDGGLEDTLGYDIPIWLSGDITGETQKCYVWNVDGSERFEAVLIWDWVGPWDSRGYIRFPEEEDA